MWTVYKHTFPNGKVYIGITSQKPENRWRNNGAGYKDNLIVTNAIKKYGWDNVKHTIIKDGLSKDEACEMEIELIAEYKSNDKTHGYNLACGGSGFCMTESQKAERSRKTKELWANNKEYREKHLKFLKTQWTAKKRAELSRKNKGKHLTEEQKRKLSESAKRRKDVSQLHTPEARAKRAENIRVRCSVPVVIYTPDGTEWWFSNIKEAAKRCGVNRRVITDHCVSGRKTKNGLYCEYARESETGRRLITLLVPPIEQRG